MKRSTSSIFFLILILTLISAGCRSTLTKTNTASSTPLSTTVHKKPIVPSTIETANQFCEKQGFTIAAQFNTDTNEMKFYCVFSGNLACEALAFVNGKCSKKSGAITFQASPDTLLERLRSCNVASPPVCGLNGKNYTNRCVAELNSVAVKHDGLCTATESSGLTLNQTTTQTPQAAFPTLPAATKQQLVKDKTETAAWLGLLIDLIQAESPKTPPTFIEQCIYPKATLYFYSSGCADCQSTLYNQNGLVLCYPSSDSAGNCPNYFNLKTKSSFCSLIWKDKR